MQVHRTQSKNNNDYE